MTTTDLSLRPAAEDQMTALYGIMALAGEHMHRVLKLSHWHPFPPSDWFKERVGDAEVFGIYKGDLLVGTFNIGLKPEPYYLEDMSAFWQEPDAPAMYFSGFGLLPAFQQQGIGTWAMSQADSLIKARGYAWMRFDAVANHEKLLHFYKRLGYQQRGVLDLGKVGVMCYEKAL